MINLERKHLSLPLLKALFLSTFLLATLCLFAAVEPDDIIGIWKDGSGKGHIQIYKQNGKYFGKIVWSIDHQKGKPKYDINNPNPSLRNQPVLGLILLKDFQFDEEEWSGGRVYNPEDGKEYKAFIKLKDKNTLALRGYIGFSWLGKTDTWTRIK